MTIFNIANSFKQRRERGWSKVYWLIDCHSTIFEGKYTRMNEGREFYPDAKEVLQWLTNREDMVFILWSSMHADAAADVIDWLSNNDITVDFYNENPMEPSTKISDFSQKFYYNIGIDDKFSFEGKTDWTLIKNELIRLEEWNKLDKVAKLV